MPEEKNYDDWSRLYALLRDVRAKAQGLLAFIAEIQKQGQLRDDSVRQAELQAAMRYRQPLCQSNFQEVKTLIQNIRGIFNKNAEVYDFFGDVITQIEDLMKLAKHGWPALNLPVDVTLRQLDEITEWLKKVVWLCALITIPQRVKIHLDQMRTGNALNFEAEFADELPEPEARTELLKYLRDHPTEVSGVVDVENGVIIKASLESGEQRSSLYRIIAVVIILGVVVGILPFASNFIRDWPFPADCFGNMVTGYIFVIIGSLAHVMIEALKQKKKAANKFAALDDWILWVHVRETSILTGIASLMFVFLFFAYTKNGKFAWATAFLVGYSIDSFLELFLQRFDKAISTQTEVMKKSLGETDDKS